MRKFLFKSVTASVVVLLFACSPNNDGGNTFTGDIDLSSQLQVDNFGSNNYERIDGNVYITTAFTNSNPDIRNLNALASLKEITGNLSIRFIRVDNLQGLHNLEKVGNRLAISNNYIEDYCALQNLVNASGVAGSIYIDSNGPFNITVEDFANGLCSLETRPFEPTIHVRSNGANVGDYVVFENTTMGDYTNEEWDFEGETYVHDKNKVMYLETGNFNVGITVSNPDVSRTVLFENYMNVTHDYSLVAFYQFIEDARDYSQFDNNGTIYGATLSEADTDTDHSYRFGQNGSSYISVPDSPTLDVTDAMSIVCFFDKDFGNIRRNMILKNPNVGSDKVPYGLYYEHPSKVVFKMSFENLSEPVELSASYSDSYTTINNSAIGTWDGTTMKLYIDGQLRNEIIIPGAGAIVNSNQPLTIGADINGGSNYFIGRLDDIRIYKKALNQNDINKLTMKWFQ